MTVAKTGERKSACDHEALSPIRKFEQKLRDQHAVDLPSWENDQAAWKSQRDQIRRDKKHFSTHDAKRAELDKLGGPAPRAPLTPILMAPDPTVEGLCRLLMGGQPIAGLFSAEGGQFMVASPGGSPQVSATTFCTVASGVGALPGLRLASRNSPSIPAMAYRRCQRHTAGRLTPTRRATSATLSRSADWSTIRALSTCF
jgi:hypothetical protein